jgi:TonB-linked SusC/RagA family outer membrane protein
MDLMLAKPAFAGTLCRLLPARWKLPKQITLVMRLTVFFLVAACLQVSAEGYSQTITLNEKNVRLQKVFVEIYRQTGYQFFYKDELLNKAGKIDVVVKDASLEEVLAICFKNQPFTYSIVSKTIIVDVKKGEVPKAIAALPIDVKGKVLNEKGEPVAATVTVKGTSLFAATNDKGEFSLKGIDAGAVLVITGVSIETRELPVNGKAELLISVKTKVSEEKEVMVTAYGIEKRTKELGYSATKVSAEEINRTSPANLLTGLTGKVSGLSVSTTGAGINPQLRILLRGIRSFGETTNNLPLFILNGAPLSFGADQEAANVMMDFINNINPNDIESVNILKGANGAALYGPEGVNGVIIINTKKGKTKPQVSFRHSSMFQVLDTRYPKLQTRFGSGSFTNQFGEGYYDPGGGSGSWGPEFDEKMVPIGRPDENGEEQMVPYKYTRERFKFYDVSQTIQNNVSVAQGDNRSDFYLGAGHTYITGLIPSDRTNRISLLMNAGRQFGKLHTRLNIGYTKMHSNVYPGQPDVLSMPAHIPITRYKDYRNDKWADHNHYWADNAPNPYEEIGINRSKKDNNAFLGNLTITVKPLTWMQITNRTGLNFYGIIEKTTREPVIYSEFGKTNGRTISSKGDRLAGVADEHNTYLTISNDLLVNSQFNMGSFSLKTTLGNSIRDNNHEKIKTSSSSLLIPVYNVVYSSITAPGEQSKVFSRSYSFFGTGTLGYKDWVFVEVTGRQDWDSKIATVARNSNYYYGANGSLVLGEAIPSIVHNKILSALRVRASVTKTANMNVLPFQAESILELRRVYPTVLSFGFDKKVVPNPYIKPEHIISQEYGIAASFLNNRINLDATYYRQRNNGVISWRSISLYSGGERTLDNIGDFLNYGWEFDLKLNPLFKLPNGIAANVEGMFSINDNKVLAIGEIPGGGGQPGLGEQVIAVGQAAYTYKMTDWKRDDQGRVIIDRVTGLPLVEYDNPRLMGRSLPKYIGSFNVHLTWKNFGLHMVGEYRGGYDHYFRSGYNMVRQGIDEITAQYGRQRFVFPNSVYDDGTGKYVTNTDIPVRSAHIELYNLYSQVETNFLISGAFWKLRELSVSYDCKIKTNWIKQLTVTLATRNLLNFYPKTNRWGDPELSTGAGTLVKDDQTAASNLNGAFSEGFIGGTRFFGISLNAGF